MPRNVVRLKSTLALATFLALSCGGGGGGGTPPPPTSPSPTPTPPGTAPLPYVNGEWSGTLESAGSPTRMISAVLIQIADCVDGGWNTVSSERWVGAISAFARPGSLDGFMSFEFPSGSRQCSGVGTLIGDATDDTATLTWTLTNYNAETCTRGVPDRMIVRLRRTK